MALHRQICQVCDGNSAGSVMLTAKGRHRQPRSGPRPVPAHQQAGRDCLPGDLDDGAGAVHPVSTVTAPTFTAEGRPDLLLSAYVMRADATAADIRAVAARLRGECGAITALLGGRDPWHPDMP